MTVQNTNGPTSSQPRSIQGIIGPLTPLALSFFSCENIYSKNNIFANKCIEELKDEKQINEILTVLSSQTLTEKYKSDYIENDFNFPTIDLAGLRNIGNTCYLNSALVFLSSVNGFIPWILDENNFRHTEQETLANGYSTKNRLEVARLIIEIYQSSNNLSSQKLAKKLKNLQKKILALKMLHNADDQKDPHEVIAKLTTLFNLEKMPGYRYNLEYKYSHKKDRDLSFTEETEANTSWYISISSGKDFILFDNMFKTEEEIDYDWQNTGNIKNREKTTRKSILTVENIEEVSHLPVYINLTRYKNGVPSKEKHSPIDPDLKVEHIIKDKASGKVYSVTLQPDAFISHIGTGASYGHYIACNRTKTGTWKIHNDVDVEEVNNGLLIPQNMLTGIAFISFSITNKKILTKPLDGQIRSKL